MALIKATDLAYGRLRSPDLDVAEEFLTNFGMVRAARTNTALYMRGTDAPHHLHVTEKGDPGFVGIAYYAASLDDLKKVAKAPGASSVEDIDEPGGGKRVRLKEPNGYQIEVVYGIKKLKPIAVKRQPLNLGSEGLERAGKVMRIHTGPSRVKRIGHAVMASPKVVETARWFRDTLGFICSDDVYAGSKDNIIGSFNRLDRGSTYDVFTGHEHIKKLGKYEHMWGIGRHLLGSQIYDYWSDPWGRVHEHWSDTDRLNVKNGSNLISAEDGLVSQWGERPPERFLNRVIA